jgi:hypothetical protein
VCIGCPSPRYSLARPALTQRCAAEIPEHDEALIRLAMVRADSGDVAGANELYRYARQVSSNVCRANVYHRPSSNLV